MKKSKKKYAVTLVFLLISAWCFSQEKFTVYGTVSDLESGEKMIGATITIPSENIGTITNEYGFYALEVPKGSHTIEIRFLGYKTIIKEVTITEKTNFDVAIAEDNETLDEVVVEANKNSTNVSGTEMSTNKLSISQIKQMPVVLGEPDVIKSLLMLPGVTNAGEAASGFNVRGGAADQNLILLDEAIIYNSSHLFGFFSIFNPDAIKDLKLYKGGIPAKYGGRVSSILDIYQKEGNNNTLKVNAGIGLLSSKLLVEGPLKKDKASFLFAGRSSYAHLFLKLTDNENSAYFYDLNTKLNYEIDPKNNLYLSGYFGRDVFSINNSFSNTYGNTTFNLRWNHLFSEKLFSNLSLIYSDYYYGLDLDLVGFEWNSGITNFNVKYDFNHYISNALKLTYGTNNIYYNFNPGEIIPTGENSGINEEALERKYAFENAFYIDVDHKITEKLSARYGLRWSNFFRLGNQHINVYDNNTPVTYNETFDIYEKGTPIDSIYYRKNKVISSFSNLEPRLALAYKINDSTSIKASYNRLNQYLHLLSNTSSPTPLDVWTPSGPYTKPQQLDQIALGYFKAFNNKRYSLEIEAFYKKVANRIDYIDGADLIANKAIEQVILNGKARAYGTEILIRKNKGDLTGWLAYTLSRAEQRTPGRTPEETGINNGNWYTAAYDKTHDISIVSNYKLNDRWQFAANFVYQTGQPATFPSGYYTYQGVNVPIYNNRNADRLTSYHHLDISATLTPRKNATRSWKSEWIFGIYNLYNRKNAASISFRQNRMTGNNKAVRLSIFGIIPSITYNIKF